METLSPIGLLRAFYPTVRAEIQSYTNLPGERKKGKFLNTLLEVKSKVTHVWERIIVGLSHGHRPGHPITTQADRAASRGLPFGAGSLAGSPDKPPALGEVTPPHPPLELPQGRG